MNAECPKGHPFATGQISATSPQVASGISMDRGAFNANVIAIYCNTCGHVYGTVLYT